MARKSGHWLVYLRSGAEVVHVLCGTEAQVNEVFAAAGAVPPGSARAVTESAVWHSRSDIYLRDGERLRVLTHAEYLDAMRAPSA